MRGRRRPDRVRRIGVLVTGDETDLARMPNVLAFTQALAGLGWTDGRNLRIDFRWSGGDLSRMQVSAKELIGLQPDIIVTNATVPTAVVQREHHREHNVERRAARQLEFGHERRAKCCGPLVQRALFAPSAAFARA
jgi:hypothetical protein